MHFDSRSQDLTNICGSFLIGNAVHLLLIQNSSIRSKCEVLSRVVNSLTVSPVLFFHVCVCVKDSCAETSMVPICQVNVASDNLMFEDCMIIHMFSVLKVKS